MYGEMLAFSANLVDNNSSVVVLDDKYGLRMNSQLRGYQVTDGAPVFLLQGLPEANLDLEGLVWPRRMESNGVHGEADVTK